MASDRDHRNPTQTELHKKGMLFFHVTKKVQVLLNSRPQMLTGLSPSLSQALLLQGGFLLSKKAAQQRHTHFLLVYPPQEEGATDLLEAVPELISTCPAWVYGLHPEPVTVAKLMECSDWPYLGHMSNHGRGGVGQLHMNMNLKA